MIILKILGIVSLLLIIFILFIIIYYYIIEYISYKKHIDFLKYLEGKSLYISTNKIIFQKHNDIIKSELSKHDIIQVDLINSSVKSIFDTDKIHRLISREKLEKFPITIKVKNEVVIKKSFYKEFKAMSRNKNEESILIEILDWYKQ